VISDLTAHGDTGETQGVGILVKSLQLRSMDGVRSIEEELAKGRTVMILRVTPLAQKSVEDLKVAVERLYASAMAMGGDIVRLGDERIVITPLSVRIWREQQP
jgi:SepF-like predicted cell division protein (DUF552 family)